MLPAGGAIGSIPVGAGHARDSRPHVGGGHARDNRSHGDLQLRGFFISLRADRRARSESARAVRPPRPATFSSLPARGGPLRRQRIAPV
jgi:hypothetical protein